MNAPKNELFFLKDLVSAHKGQVANRTLAQGGKATLCLMALAPGEEISTHSAPCDALVTALEGSCTITVGQEIHHIVAGQALVMPAQMPHSLKSDEGFKMMLVLVQ